MFHLSLIDPLHAEAGVLAAGAAIVIGMAALLLERLIRLLDLFANRGGPLTLILKMLGTLSALPRDRDPAAFSSASLCDAAAVERQRARRHARQRPVIAPSRRPMLVMASC